jgi:hypothetical protein
MTIRRMIYAWKPLTEIASAFDFEKFGEGYHFIGSYDGNC